MNTIVQIAMVIVALYIVAEVCSAIYIYRNRDVVVPKLRIVIRNLFGLNSDQSVADAHNRIRNAEYQDLCNKMNFIGKHVEFERAALRARGVQVPAIKLNRVDN